MTENTQERIKRITEEVHEEITKIDFNISPSRYIHTDEGNAYRTIGEIADELEELEAEAEATRQQLKGILKVLR